MDSSLSVPEFNAILLALRQTHNIANIALDSIIKLLELYLPKGRQLPKQVTFLKRKQKKTSGVWWPGSAIHNFRLFFYFKYINFVLKNEITKKEN